MLHRYHYDNDDNLKKIRNIGGERNPSSHPPHRRPWKVISMSEESWSLPPYLTLLHCWTFFHHGQLHQYWSWTGRKMFGEAEYVCMQIGWGQWEKESTVSTLPPFAPLEVVADSLVFYMWMMQICEGQSNSPLHFKSELKSLSYCDGTVL